MAPSNSTSNGSDEPYVSPKVVGVFCGALLFFVLLTGTFLWWPRLFPHLQKFTRWLRSKAATGFSSSPPQSAIPAVDPPRPTPLAPIVTRSLQTRQHGPDSVDTLPPYTPSSTSPTEYNTSAAP